MKFHYRRNSPPLLLPLLVHLAIYLGEETLGPSVVEPVVVERVGIGSEGGSRSRASRPLRGHLRLICALLGRRKRIAETSTISFQFHSIRLEDRTNERTNIERMRIKKKLEGSYANKFSVNLLPIFHFSFSVVTYN